METPITTNTEIALPIKPEDVIEKIKAALPRLIKGRDGCVNALKGITSIETDEELEAASGLLVKVRNTYGQMEELRKTTTAPLDELKSKMMEYEKDVENEGKRVRQVVAKYNQVKIDKKNADEAAAAKVKEKENHKVDLSARMKKNLSDFVINRVREFDDGSAKWFNEMTLDNYDVLSGQFKSYKPKMKDTQYLDCFKIEFNKNLITQEEFDELVKDVKTQETYEKWNTEVVKVLAPTFNDWVAKLPERKEELLKLKNATDDAERKKIEEDQKRKAEDEQRERQRQLNEMQKQSDEAIERSVDVDKMENEFREQAVNQQSDDVGPVKVIMKFKDDKPVKAISEIIYQSFMHPKFPSIVKKNKDGSDKFDEHGFPVYVDWVDSLVKFFVKHGDLNIQGIETKEISKVIIRK